jgi:transaldolase/glucose-6-phosphate isomerase
VTSNPLRQLGEAGQAVWLDFVQRKMLDDGGLRKLVEDDGLTGVTSNPSIFDKAIGSGDYDAALKAFVDVGDAEPAVVFEHLAIQDIQAAADQLRPVYDRMGGRDGYVSLEVSPYLAMDTEGTLTEARRLWGAVNRPNLMIKVPGTHAGVPAIRTLIGEGINVNVTLLFGLDAYKAVAEAHIAGLEALAANGGDISKVAGVASFFVSRIDTQIDEAIDRRLKAGAGADEADLKKVRGKVAIANAKIAYQHYLAMIETPRWKALAAKGAAPQRLLWASTGTKNPDYSDVLYVASLIGPETVNTIPPKTMDAFRDHGQVTQTLTAGVDEAKDVLATAERLGLDLAGVTTRLVDDGVRQFADAADGLYGAVAQKRLDALGDKLAGQSAKLPEALNSAVAALRETARAQGWSRRLWNGDASLWTGKDEAKWLGWLAAGEGKAVDLAALDALKDKVKQGGFTHVLLLGMGGSSLGPEVLGEVCDAAPGAPRLLVLDSTDPTQVARFEAAIDPAKTLFVVSSKSGTTLEPDILERYFFQVAARAVGEDQAGARFVAVTDPGSQLQSRAESARFLEVFLGDPAIGGRFSVLSNFGMVPPAAAGVDVRRLLAQTQTMVRACAASAPPAVNPGVELGLILGAAAKAGRDKLTILASPALAPVAAWLEQLIAESTGKTGKGIIPVAGEAAAKPGAYGSDRVFAYLSLKGDADAGQERAVTALEAAGQPVVRMTLANRDQLGQEFFRWEIATAVAGAVLGIDPFDQPDVEASKIKTRALTDAYEQTGALKPETPLLEDRGVSLFVDERNAADLKAASTLENAVAAHFKRARAGDYIGLLAYIDRSPAHVAAVAGMQTALRDATGCAVVVGFGPRFLHSTGQAYKGGPNSGVFLEITGDPLRDLQVPGRKFSFGVVEAAQARGDLEVLDERGRRTLRAHLGTDVEGGLKTLAEAIAKVFAPAPVA